MQSDPHQRPPPQIIAEEKHLRSVTVRVDAVDVEWNHFEMGRHRVDAVDAHDGVQRRVDVRKLLLVAAQQRRQKAPDHRLCQNAISIYRDNSHLDDCSRHYHR